MQCRLAMRISGTNKPLNVPKLSLHRSISPDFLCYFILLVFLIVMLKFPNQMKFSYKVVE